MTMNKRLLQISFRNVFRNKRRTLLTLLILTLGSTGLILVGGFFDGIHDSFREMYIHGQTGHIQVNQKGYYENGVAAPFKYLMKNASQVEGLIAQNPHILYAVPEVKFGGMANTDKNNVAVLAIGIDPVLQKQMAQSKYSLKNGKTGNIVAGQDLDPGDPTGVVVGQGLLQALGLKIGDSFSFITTREGGIMDGAEYHIRGTFQTVLKDYDDRGLKMNLATAQKLLNIPDEVHSLLLVLDKTENTDLVQAQLTSAIQQAKLPLESITWLTQGEFYRNGKGILDKIYGTVLAIIAIVFFFSIANTINMAVFERIREFGTMMATGNSRAVIFSVIFFEALIVGIMGGLLGLGLGAVAAKVISSFGIVLPPLPGSSSSYIALIFLEPMNMVKVFTIGFFSTVLAAIIPAYRACHFEIIHALGYV